MLRRDSDGRTTWCSVFGWRLRSLEVKTEEHGASPLDCRRTRRFALFQLPSSISSLPLGTLETMGCNQSTPVSNPAADAPPTSVTAAAVPSAPASNASVLVAVEPESEAAPASSPAKNGKYLISGVSITEDGIVYYHIHPTSDPNAEGIKHRYNDFKALYTELNGTESLPPLPQANLRTYFRGRHNQHLMKERENQFADILNAIANDATLSTTPAFQKFVS